MNTKNKLNSEMVPEGFGVGLVLFDMMPVLFFGMILGLIAKIFPSMGFVIGAFFIFMGGFLKATWKLVIAIWHKNIWILNRQMKYMMCSGFVLVACSIAIDRDMIDIRKVMTQVRSLPSLLFFVLGFLGMGVMIYFAGHMDQSDAKANWKEQIINTLAQGFFFLGVLFAIMH